MRRRLTFLKALGPLTVCIISIALMNIFKWYNDTTGVTINDKPQPLIAQIGKIPKGEARSRCRAGACHRRPSVQITDLRQPKCSLVARLY